MKKMLWMLAAAASLAACHNRGEDDMGAAPERGDTTAVTMPATVHGVSGPRRKRLPSSLSFRRGFGGW